MIEERQTMIPAANGWEDPYPHNDSFGKSCTLPCCNPEIGGEYPWTCSGPGCRLQLRAKGLCIPCAEKAGKLEKPIFGTLGDLLKKKIARFAFGRRSLI